VTGGRFEGVGTVANVFGAHWAAVYISKTKNSVEYFDSEGSPPPCSLEVLLDTLAVSVTVGRVNTARLLDMCGNHG
jgi:hypothetical protein